MEASILIVSKNRKKELRRTLRILEQSVNKEIHEVLIFLDGCTDDSANLREEFAQANWIISQKSLGASKARSILYKKANGKLLFGFDDDAHPLRKDFISISENIFAKNSNLGIIAFKEIKGIFESDEEIPEALQIKNKDYLVKDFLGCGFAIKKEVYEETRGFPVWIDIYGEEVCVAMETLELGFDILFTHQIAVNHRTQKQKNNIAGANYFRFEKQLKNTAFFYLVYYPFPLLLSKIGRLYYLNFKKYAMKDFRFLGKYITSLCSAILAIPNIMKFRKPVDKNIISKFNKLENPQY